MEVDLVIKFVGRPATPQPWDRAISIPGNPNIPSPRDAMARVFSAEEAARYEAHVRPQVEAGRGVVREAVAYLAAMKPERPSAPPVEEASR